MWTCLLILYIINKNLLILFSISFLLLQDDAKGYIQYYNDEKKTHKSRKLCSKIDD